ncbi:MAG: universal stress protein [Clostridia bacterium]
MGPDDRGTIRVTLASDGSPDALAAADWISERLAPWAVSCTVLTVVERGWDSDSTSERPGLDVDQEWALPAARRTALRLNGIPVTIRILHGDAVREVLRDLRDNPADLLVVGHRGLRGVGGLVMGSVSQALVHYAPVPVLVIPPTPVRQPSYHTAKA